MSDHVPATTAYVQVLLSTGALADDLLAQTLLVVIAARYRKRSIVGDERRRLVRVWRHASETAVSLIASELRQTPDVDPEGESDRRDSPLVDEASNR